MSLPIQLQVCKPHSISQKFLPIELSFSCPFLPVPFLIVDQKSEMKTLLLVTLLLKKTRKQEMPKELL